MFIIDRKERLKREQTLLEAQKRLQIEENCAKLSGIEVEKAKVERLKAEEEARESLTCLQNEYEKYRREVIKRDQIGERLNKHCQVFTVYSLTVLTKAEPHFGGQGGSGSQED